MANPRKGDRPISQAQKVRRLKEQICEVVVKIEYGGRDAYDDTVELAKELDRRKIRPFTRSSTSPGVGTWYHPNARGARLKAFMSEHLPDVWKRGFRALLKPGDTADDCLCSKCRLNGTEKCKRLSAPKPGRPSQAVVPDGVVPENGDVPKNILGWTVFHDRKRGRYKLVKRIDGKSLSIYIGKTWDLSLAAARIREWTERQSTDSEK